VRRLVAAGAVVLVIVLMVVLVKGCVDNRREAALKDYNRSVHTLVEQSRSEVSKQLFDALSGASGQDQQQVQETISQLTSSADEQLAQAQRLDPPDAMKEAQSDLVLLMSLRRDGVAKIADLIQTALGGTAGAGRAVDEIAGQMQAFNASDVVYSQRVAPLILKGLKDDGIAASYDGTAGEEVLPYASFLPEGTGLSWLSPDYVAQQLGAPTSSGRPSGTPTPGLHGHQLDSVSVNGVDLTTDGPNRLPASPPPTFTVNFTNGGDNDETNVKVTVEISGSGPTLRAQAIVASTTAGAAATASVTMRQSPSTSGSSTIRVTVEPVLGEGNTDNNTATYTALFEG
jgi:CARDB